MHRERAALHRALAEERAARRAEADTAAARASAVESLEVRMRVLQDANADLMRASLPASPPGAGAAADLRAALSGAAAALATLGGGSEGGDRPVTPPRWRPSTAVAATPGSAVSGRSSAAAGGVELVGALGGPVGGYVSGGSSAAVARADLFCGALSGPLHANSCGAGLDGQQIYAPVGGPLAEAAESSLGRPPAGWASAGRFGAGRSLEATLGLGLGRPNPTPGHAAGPSVGPEEPCCGDASPAAQLARSPDAEPDGLFERAGVIVADAVGAEGPLGEPVEHGAGAAADEELLQASNADAVVAGKAELDVGGRQPPPALLPGAPGATAAGATAAGELGKEVGEREQMMVPLPGAPGAAEASVLREPRRAGRPASVSGSPLVGSPVHACGWASLVGSPAPQPEAALMGSPMQAGQWAALVGSPALAPGSPLVRFPGAGKGRELKFDKGGAAGGEALEEDKENIYIAS